MRRQRMEDLMGNPETPCLIIPPYAPSAALFPTLAIADIELNQLPHQS